MRVNRPISICYTNNIFSFYTPVTGTRVFEISDRTLKKNSHGYVVEDFLNAVGDNNMKGDYHIEITYGITKVILINFTRFGEAYVVESKGFLGSPQQNTLSKSLVKRIKTGKADVAKKAEAFIDVQKRFLDSCKIVFNKGHNEIRCLLSISKDGEVTSVMVENMTISATGSPLDIHNKIVETFKSMPLWKPATDNEGHYIDSQIEVKITTD